MKRVVLRNIEDRQQAQMQVQPKAQMQVHSRRQAHEQRNMRSSKKRLLLIALLLFLFLASTISAATGYLLYHAYHTDLLLAQSGMRHLRTATTLLESLQARPFAPHTVEQAQREFTGALSDSQSLQQGLARFSGVANLTPVYGPRLRAAIHLSALAIDASRAGIDGCKILEVLLAHLSSPLKASSSGLTNADFTTLSSEYQKLKTSLNAAINDALLVQPGDVSFDAHLAKVFHEFQANIPRIHAMVGEADQLLPTLPTLLGIGTPSRYLLEILDSTELRPGGGFIGNYGIATLSGGRLASARITDVDLLDRPYEFAGHTISYPPAYSWFSHYLASTSWSLRDSNLDADFPTAARYGELNFEREGGNVPLQGVVAITPYFIEQLLNITGPIGVPEYHQRVTAQNLISLIHFYQLGGKAAGQGSDLIQAPGGHSSLRKRFTELLGEHLLTSVQQLSSSALPKFVQAFSRAISSKDVQVYLNASAAENVLLRNHLASTIESRGGDSLFVVDANVGADKANRFISSAVRDQVTIASNGDAVHRVTLRYAWTTSGNVYGSSSYKDYVRIYAPPGSTLSEQEGWQPLGTSTAFGTRVWAGFFTLVYGQTRTINLVWTSNGVAKRGANSWHYQYVLQRQAGAQRTLALQVMLPSCASATNRWGGLKAGGKQEEEASTQAFARDLNVGVDYACK